MRIFKVKFILFTLVILLALVGCQDKPKVKLTTISGKEYSLNAMTGKWIIINYWATWCAPCRKEIPELNKLAKEHSANVQVFGMSFDPLTREVLQAAIKKMQIQFPNLVDNPMYAFGINQLTGLPATLIISPQGKFYKLLYGPQTQKKLLALLKIK
ncbi:MAG: TlpA disulfide reductase family protein [Pseudomonadota bacterium]